MDDVHSSPQRVWRLGVIAVVIAGVIAAVIILAVVWFFLQTYPISSHGRETIVSVHTGDSLSTLGGELAKDHVIAS